MQYSTVTLEFSLKGWPSDIGFLKNDRSVRKNMKNTQKCLSDKDEYITCAL